MAFDPTKPADHSPIVAQELRDQLNALRAESAKSIDTFGDPEFEFSDPPTYNDLRAIGDTLIDLVKRLKGL